jgi:radical SAM protein with 4Fe4S-binding SPASM domain
LAQKRIWIGENQGEKSDKIKKMTHETYGFYPCGKMKNDLKLKELTFEITKKCPMQCLLCSSNGGIACDREFTFNEIKNIIDESIQLGTKHVNLSGGEPLIHPEILKFCSYIKEKGLTIDVYTCGNIGSLDDNNRSIDKELLTSLKEIGIDKLIFSIHGNNAETHESITTRKGSFDNLINSIKKSIKTGLFTELHFVPTRLNFTTLPEVMKLADRLGVNKISVLRFVPQGRGLINRNILEIKSNEIAELKNILQDIRDRYSSHKLRIGAPYNCFQLSNQTFCNAGIDKATIKPNGFVIPCVSMKDFIVEKEDNNIWVRSLSDIWSDSTLFNISRKSLKIIEQESLCNTCEHFSRCKGGCLTQRLINNKLEDKDPYCLIYDGETMAVNDEPVGFDGTLWLSYHRRGLALLVLFIMFALTFLMGFITGRW